MHIDKLSCLTWCESAEKVFCLVEAVLMESQENYANALQMFAMKKPVLFV